MARTRRQTDMNLSQAAKKIIPLARKIRSYHDTELPKRFSQYSIIGAGEEGPPPPPEERALARFLDELPPDLVYKLLLVMCIGRGDFGVDDLAGAYASLKQKFAELRWAASLMRGKAPLADYLSDGLAELERHGLSVDHLPVENTEQANNT